MPERLALAHGDLHLDSRRIEVPDAEDAIEVAYDRGWSDGLPIVPPTPLRVAMMLSGTSRKPDEVIGLIPPNLSECTVEKAAANAVMAGCRPEYFPVVLAVIEAALDPRFSMHGLLATLWFSGPVIVVNGPIAKRIGMNSQGNALGQGNRANATIGRALQLVIRNVGGGVPGGPLEAGRAQSRRESVKEDPSHSSEDLAREASEAMSKRRADRDGGGTAVAERVVASPLSKRIA
jgi:hypothetical protein